MAFVALAVALALSLICLVSDNRQAVGVSAALWLPTLWMMRVGSRSLAYWLPGSLSSLGDPVALSLLTIAGFAILASRGQRLGSLLKHNPTFLLFFLYISLSVFWTGDLPDALKRWFRAVGDVTMALIVLTEMKPLSAFVSVMRRAVLVLMPLSLVICVFLPELGVGGRGEWVGVTVDKNWLGVLCAVSTASVLLNRLMRKQRPELAVNIRIAGIPFEIVYLPLSLFLLWGGGGSPESRSSSAVVLLVLMIGLFYGAAYVRRKQLHVGFVVTTIAAAVLVFQVLPEVAGRRTLTDHIIEDVLHKDVNLTDRTDLWPILIDKGMQHPWLGAGFDSFFSEEMQKDIFEELAHTTGTYFSPNQAHNGFIQVFVNLGFVGLILLALMIVSGFRGTRRILQSDFDWGRIRLTLLLFVLVSNHTEASFTRPTEFVWFLFLLAVINPGDRQASKQPVAVPVSRHTPVHEFRLAKQSWVSAQGVDHRRTPSRSKAYVASWRR
jgi:exopolysaccharide production protein ExoQ